MINEYEVAMCSLWLLRIRRTQSFLLSAYYFGTTAYNFRLISLKLCEIDPCIGDRCGVYCFITFVSSFEIQLLLVKFLEQISMSKPTTPTRCSIGETSGVWRYNVKHKHHSSQQPTSTHNDWRYISVNVSTRGCVKYDGDRMVDRQITS